MTMDTSLEILMEGLIDYAGLFPPASLDMPTAVANYAAYREGAQAPWLGRFVLPMSRLEEFTRALSGLGRGAALPGSGGQASADPNPGGQGPGGQDPKGRNPGAERRPWRLSALIGKDFAGDLAAVAAFNRSGDGADGRPVTGPGATIIDAVEMKAERAGEIRAAMERIPEGVTPYFEIPIQADPGPLIRVLAGAGGRAKVRTGGVTVALIPAPEDLARFILACAEARVPFKATAGLHHPVRSSRRLTYEPDSAEAVMHGFLNVFLAAAFAAEGMDPASLAELLREESPRAFAFRDDAVAWRGFQLEGPRLKAARRDFAIAFGSCSFEEPRDDLKEAGLL